MRVIFMGGRGTLFLWRGLVHCLFLLAFWLLAKKKILFFRVRFSVRGLEATLQWDLALAGGFHLLNFLMCRGISAEGGFVFCDV